MRATGADAATAASSSRDTTELLGDRGEGAVQRAAAAFDQLTRGAAHAIHFFGILEEVNHFYAGVFGAFDLDGGARFDKARGYCGEIFHGRPEDRDLSKCGGFEDIVAAGIYQGAADEDAVGETVQRGEFADGIEQEDGNVVGNAIVSGVYIWGNAGTRKR